jgi:DNA-binding NtrC family response regulator
MNKPVRTIGPRALEQLLAHSWPGNVRELEHVIQRAVALASGDAIASVAFAPAMAGLAAGANSGRPSLSLPVGTTLDEASRRLIQATVDHCAGNKLQAARMLGIPPRTMYRHFAGLKASAGGNRAHVDGQSEEAGTSESSLDGPKAGG